MVDQKSNDEYMMPSEVSKEKVTHLALKLTHKLKTDYRALCAAKKTNVSKRLRNFMIYELKREEASRVNPVQSNEIQKPKDLNTDVSAN
jgi:hypothetical protein